MEKKEGGEERKGRVRRNDGGGFTVVKEVQCGKGGVAKTMD